MTTTFENLTLCVPRGGASNLRNATLVNSTIREIPSSHIVLKVDKFGFSANNVTYGALGENSHFRYFDFYPVPETETTSPKTHGIIPVWGFGTVVASSTPGINVGERLYGYLPMTRFALLPIDTKAITAYNLYIPLGSFPPDRRPYKQLIRCSKDEQYQPNKEDETMLYRPLFWTSYWFEDKLNIEKYYGAKRILISSASSKTAFCLAYVIRKRGMNGVKVVGLTSRKNVGFTKGLGLYDEVLTYDGLSGMMVKDGPWVYVDVAGNAGLNRQILAHLDGHLATAVALGMTNVSEAKTSPVVSHNSKSNATAATTPAMSMFFMPEHLIVRRGELSVKEITGMQKVAWDRLMEDCGKWVRLERTMGNGVLEKYQGTVDGKVGPELGMVFSLWDQTQAIQAKL